MAPSYLPVSTQDTDVAATANSNVVHMATTTLKVEGMTCGACTSAVEAAFKGVDGIGNVSVSLVMERAVVIHDPAKVSADTVKEMIEDRGFDAEVISSDLPRVSASGMEQSIDDSLSTTTVSVGGMTCGACTSAVEGAFKNVAGVKSFSISLLSERAVLEHDANILPAEKIAEIIEDTGFDASIISTEKVSRPDEAVGSGPKVATTTVGIEGMTCGACTKAVTDGFEGVDGVFQFNISLLAERAIVVHDPEKLSPEKITEIIEDRGFDATLLSSVASGSQVSKSHSTAHLKVYGLPTEQSASELEGKLRSLNGVESASINIKTMRATVIFNSSVIGLRSIVEAIENAGYNALVADADDNNAQLESLAKTKEIQEWRHAFRFSLSFAIPVFLTSMIIPMCFPFLDFGSIQIACGLWLGDVICLILTIPVQFGIGKRFYVSAYKSLSHGSPTMDVLVVLGTSAAFFFSIAAMLVSIVTPPHSRPATVFDTSTMLITFITLGRWLENRAKGQTSKALSRLMSLAPSMATIYADPIAAEKLAEGWAASEKDGERMVGGTEEKTIPTELLELGDIVIIKPGDKIPADGAVIRGESYVEESMVTGEALPILKKKGSSVMAGSVNGTGRMDFRVTRAGSDTQLSQIVRLVQEAQTSRAPIQRIADMVAGYFVPIIISLGVATFVGWMILSHVLPNPPQIFEDNESGGRVMVCVKLCISVIVFACPCALGLATPTAIMVGTGVGAQQGILVKGGAALETATKINHVVLDKTGTLTVGKMSVSKADIQGGYKETAEKTRLWWTLIGLAEMNSEHPIARAIVLAAKEGLGLGADSALDGSVGDFNATVGKGISATVEATISPDRKRHQVLIGNASFLRANGIIVPTTADEEADRRNTLDSIRLEEEPSSASGPQARHAGTTTIHTAISNTYTGTLSLSDTIKPTARAAIRALARMGISASIVTGDTESSALVVAHQVGIPSASVHASATPEDKQRIISEMSASGKIVAMVGDGINDSPALASAAVGIALSSGTDVAMEAAGVVLMSSDDLLAIPASLNLSKSIFRRIKMNLLWACGYNIIGLPFAMGFFLPWGYSLHPMAAGAAMACSSVSVVMSSLALRWWKRPKWMSVEVLDPEMADLVPTTTPVVEGMQKAETEAGGSRGLLDRLMTALGKKRTKKREQEYMPLRDIGDV
jgi:P-type Cu+ transporter